MKKPSTFLTDAEVALVLKCPDKGTKAGLRDYALLLLMTETGLRKAEICSLRFQSLVSHRQRFVVDVIGKGKRFRRVPLTSNCVTALHDYWKSERLGNALNDPFFLTLGKHGPYSKGPITPCAVEEVIEKYSKIANISKKVSPHTFRHTFATSLLINGTDIRSVQELLGHTSVQTTQIYCHSDEEVQCKAVDELSKRLAKLLHA